MGDKDVSERIHQGEMWILNQNHSKGIKKGVPTAWEKQCKTLLALGIDKEELKKYQRRINSPIDKVNNWNEDIIQRINGIDECRRQEFAFRADGVTGPDLSNTLRRMGGLYNQIDELQKKIKAAGGICEEVPSLFKKPIRMGSLAR